MEYTGCILVEDASGCRFEVREYRKRRLLTRVAIFELETGEQVHRLDADTFVITRTGEGLVRIACA